MVLDIVDGAVLALGLSLATNRALRHAAHADVFEQLHAAGLITGPAIVLVLLASVATLNIA